MSARPSLTGQDSDLLDRLSADCPVLHVDMDAFYASVAIRERPELAAVPVVVGGGSRSVVLAANYPARAFGIRSATPMSRVHRLCPQAVVIAPDFGLVQRVSDSVMETFRRVTPVVQTVSVDEAFLDVSGSVRRLGSPFRIAERLRSMIHDEQQITCSVGVAASMSVAKLASRRAKPDGVLVIPPSRVTSVLHPLDVGELWGVGEKTRAALHRLGLFTVGDVAHTDRHILQRAVGSAAGIHLHELAWGTDRREVSIRHSHAAPERSMGAEETFAADTDDREVVLRELLRLSARVSRRMRVAAVAGRTVSIKVRFADFSSITRSRTRPEATDVTHEIHAVATELYEALGLQRARVRLVGVRVEGLVPRSSVHRQLRLGEREHGWEDADRAVDAAVRRFGSAAVGPASLLGQTHRSGS